MKSFLITLSLFVSNYCLSQTIHITTDKNYRYPCDYRVYKIYFVDNEWQADWVVYLTDSVEESKQMDGWWYVTNSPAKAIIHAYQTTDKWEAERLVFITKDKWAVQMGRD
jgi:hypothetical protein